MAPVIYTFAKLKKLDTAGQGWSGVLLLASALYFASWALVGRLEEVRIFIPFAFGLIPLTANVLASRFETESQNGQASKVL